MHKPFLRNISAVLVVSFMLQDISWAASEIVSQALDHSPKKIELSSEFSKITGEYVGKQAKRIIHIQDAHTNLSAQRNLAKVIEELVTRHKIQTVFVEGGTQDDSLTFLRPLADKKTRERVAKKYMIQGEMAGEEYLSLSSDLDFKILGVEDLSLYKKNLEYYRSIAHSRDKIFTALHEIEKRSDTLKRQLYPEHMLKLDDVIRRFEKKEADFSDLFDALSAEAKKSGVNLLDYPQFLSLGRLKDEEAQINFQKANEEQALLIQAIQKADPEHARELQKIAGKTQKLKYQSRELGAFYALLLKEAAKYAVGATELKKYSDYLGFYGSLHFEELLEEIASLEKEIFQKSLSTGAAFTLYEYSSYLKKLKTLFSLQATRDDVEAYLEARKETRFRTVSVLAFLNRALYDLNREAEVLTHDSLIEDNLKTVEAFYEATRERDEIFVQKALDQMDKQKISSAALITGGYHTQNLKKLLAIRKVSYTVVTPHVLEETNHKRYEKLLLSQFGGSSLTGAGAAPALNFQRMKSYMKMGTFAGRPDAVEGARLSLLQSAPAHQRTSAPEKTGARLADTRQKSDQEAEVLNALSALSGLIPEAIKQDWLAEFSDDMTRIPADDIAEISKFKSELSHFYTILSLIRDGHIKLTEPTKKYLAQFYHWTLSRIIHTPHLAKPDKLGALIAFYALIPMIDAHKVLQTLKDFMTSNQGGDTQLSHRVLQVLELLLSVAFFPVADYLVEVMDGHPNRDVRGAADSIVTNFLQKIGLSSEGNLGPIISDSIRFKDHSSQTDRLKTMIKDGRLKAGDKIVVTYLDRSSGSWQLVTEPATFVKKPYLWSGDVVEVLIDGSEMPIRLMIGDASMRRLVSMVKSGADNALATISTVLEQLKKLEGKTDQLISVTYRRKDPAGKNPDSNITEIGKLVSVWYGDYDGGVEIQVGDKKLKFSTSSPVMPLIKVKIGTGGARLADQEEWKQHENGDWFARAFAVQKWFEEQEAGRIAPAEALKHIYSILSAESLQEDGGDDLVKFLAISKIGHLLITLSPYETQGDEFQTLIKNAEALLLDYYLVPKVDGEMGRRIRSELLWSLGALDQNKVSHGPTFQYVTIQDYQRMDATTLRRIFNSKNLRMPVVVQFIYRRPINSEMMPVFGAFHMSGLATSYNSKSQILTVKTGDKEHLYSFKDGGENQILWLRTQSFNDTLAAGARLAEADPSTLDQQNTEPSVPISLTTRVGNYLKDEAAIKEKLQELDAANSYQIEYDKHLKDYTTLNTSAYATAYVEPTTVIELEAILRHTYQNNIEVFFLGKGSNVLIADRLKGLVISTIGLEHVYIDEDKALIEADAGVSLIRLAKLAQESGLSGLEFAISIPGTIGGAVFTAASYPKDIHEAQLRGAGVATENFIYRISDIVDSVEALWMDGTRVTLDGDVLGFGYRTSVFQELPLYVYRVRLKLTNGSPDEIKKTMDLVRGSRRALRDRTLSDDSSLRIFNRTIGRAFKNADPSYNGLKSENMIREAGIESLSVGGMKQVPNRPGVIYNDGSGTALDYLMLVEQIEKYIQEKFKIRLVRQIQVFPYGVNSEQLLFIQNPIRGARLAQDDFAKKAGTPYALAATLGVVGVVFLGGQLWLARDVAETLSNRADQFNQARRPFDDGDIQLGPVTVRFARIDDFEQIKSTQINSYAHPSTYLSDETIRANIISNQVLVAEAEIKGAKQIVGEVFITVSNENLIKLYKNISNPAYFDPAGGVLFDYWIVVNKKYGKVGEVKISKALIDMSKDLADRADKKTMAYSRPGDALDNLNLSERHALLNQHWGDLNYRLNLILRHIFSVQSKNSKREQVAASTEPVQKWLKEKLHLDVAAIGNDSSKAAKLLNQAFYPRPGVGALFQKRNISASVTLSGLILRFFLDDMSDWVGTDPALHILHNRAYLKYVYPGSRPTDFLALGSNAIMSYEMAHLDKIARLARVEAELFPLLVKLGHNPTPAGRGSRLSAADKVKAYLKTSYGWTNVYVSGAGDFGNVAAGVMTEKVRAMQDAMPLGQFLNGALATGRTMEPVYAALVQDANDDNAIRWDRLNVFQVDERTGLGKNHSQNWRTFLTEKLLSKLPSTNNVVKSRLNWIFDYIDLYRGGVSTPYHGSPMTSYRRALKSSTYFVTLGLGEDGHMAYILPGTSMNDKTRDSVTVPDYDGRMPDSKLRRAKTLTLDDILKADHIFFFVNGPHKADILAKIFEGHFDMNYPASALTTLPSYKISVVFDEEAITELAAAIDSSRRERAGSRLSGHHDPIIAHTDESGAFSFQNKKYRASAEYGHKTLSLQKHPRLSSIYRVYFDNKKIGRIHLKERIFVFDEEVRITDEKGAFKWKGKRYPLGVAYKNLSVSIRPISPINPHPRYYVFVNNRRVADIGVGSSDMNLSRPWQVRKVESGRFKFHGTRYVVRKQSSGQPRRVFVRALGTETIAIKDGRGNKIEAIPVGRGARLSQPSNDPKEWVIPPDTQLTTRQIEAIISNAGWYWSPDMLARASYSIIQSRIEGVVREAIRMDRLPRILLYKDNGHTYRISVKHILFDLVKLRFDWMGESSHVEPDEYGYIGAVFDSLLGYQLSPEQFDALFNSIIDTSRIMNDLRSALIQLPSLAAYSGYKYQSEYNYQDMVESFGDIVDDQEAPLILAAYARELMNLPVDNPASSQGSRLAISERAYSLAELGEQANGYFDALVGVIRASVGQNGHKKTSPQMSAIPTSILYVPRYEASQEVKLDFIEAKRLVFYLLNHVFNENQALINQVSLANEKVEPRVISSGEDNFIRRDEMLVVGVDGSLTLKPNSPEDALGKMRDITQAMKPYSREHQVLEVKPDADLDRVLKPVIWQAVQSSYERDPNQVKIHFMLDSQEVLVRRVKATKKHGFSNIWLHLRAQIRQKLPDIYKKATYQVSWRKIDDTDLRVDIRVKGARLSQNQADDAAGMDMFSIPSASGYVPFEKLRETILGHVMGAASVSANGEKIYYFYKSPSYEESRPIALVSVTNHAVSAGLFKNNWIRIANVIQMQDSNYEGLTYRVVRIGRNIMISSDDFDPYSDHVRDLDPGSVQPTPADNPSLVPAMGARLSDNGRPLNHDQVLEKITEFQPVEVRFASEANGYTSFRSRAGALDAVKSYLFRQPAGIQFTWKSTPKKTLDFFPYDAQTIQNSQRGWQYHNRYDSGGQGMIGLGIMVESELQLVNDMRKRAGKSPISMQNIRQVNYKIRNDRRNISIPVGTPADKVIEMLGEKVGGNASVDIWYDEVIYPDEFDARVGARLAETQRTVDSGSDVYRPETLDDPKRQNFAKASELREFLRVAFFSQKINDHLKTASLRDRYIWFQLKSRMGSERFALALKALRLAGDLDIADMTGKDVVRWLNTRTRELAHKKDDNNERPTAVQLASQSVTAALASVNDSPIGVASAKYLTLALTRGMSQEQVTQAMELAARADLAPQQILRLVQRYSLTVPVAAAAASLVKSHKSNNASVVKWIMRVHAASKGYGDHPDMIASLWEQASLQERHEAAIELDKLLDIRDEFAQLEMTGKLENKIITMENLFDLYNIVGSTEEVQVVLEAIFNTPISDLEPQSDYVNYHRFERAKFFLQDRSRSAMDMVDMLSQHVNLRDLETETGGARLADYQTVSGRPNEATPNLRVLKDVLPKLRRSIEVYEDLYRKYLDAGNVSEIFKVPFLNELIAWTSSKPQNDFIPYISIPDLNAFYVDSSISPDLLMGERDGDERLKLNTKRLGRYRPGQHNLGLDLYRDKPATKTKKDHELLGDAWDVTHKISKYLEDYFGSRRHYHFSLGRVNSKKTPLWLDLNKKRKNGHLFALEFDSSLLDLSPEEISALLRFSKSHMHLSNSVALGNEVDREMVAYFEQARELMSDEHYMLMLKNAFIELGNHGWNVAPFIGYLNALAKARSDKKIKAGLDLPDHATSGQDVSVHVRYRSTLVELTRRAMAGLNSNVSRHRSQRASIPVVGLSYVVPTVEEVKSFQEYFGVKSFDDAAKAMMGHSRFLLIVRAIGWDEVVSLFKLNISAGILTSPDAIVSIAVRVLFDQESEDDYKQSPLAQQYERALYAHSILKLLIGEKLLTTLLEDLKIDQSLLFLNSIYGILYPSRKISDKKTKLHRYKSLSPGIKEWVDGIRRGDWGSAQGYLASGQDPMVIYNVISAMDNMEVGNSSQLIDARRNAVGAIVQRWGLATGLLLRGDTQESHLAFIKKHREYLEAAVTDPTRLERSATLESRLHLSRELELAENPELTKEAELALGDDPVFILNTSITDPSTTYASQRAAFRYLLHHRHPATIKKLAAAMANKLRSSARSAPTSYPYLEDIFAQGDENVEDVKVIARYMLWYLILSKNVQLKKERLARMLEVLDTYPIAARSQVLDELVQTEDEFAELVKKAAAYPSFLGYYAKHISRGQLVKVAGYLPRASLEIIRIFLPHLPTDIFYEMLRQVDYQDAKILLIAETYNRTVRHLSEEFTDYSNPPAKIQNHYAVLGVPRNASLEQIRKSYRLLSFVFHPDRYRSFDEGSQAIAAAQSQKINEAHKVLMNQEERQKYNKKISRYADHYLLEPWLTNVPYRELEKSISLTDTDAQEENEGARLAVAARRTSARLPDGQAPDTSRQFKATLDNGRQGSEEIERNDSRPAISRREFLKLSTLAGASVALGSATIHAQEASNFNVWIPNEGVRLGAEITREGNALSILTNGGSSATEIVYDLKNLQTVLVDSRFETGDYSMDSNPGHYFNRLYHAIDLLEHGRDYLTREKMEHADKLASLADLLRKQDPDFELTIPQSKELGDGYVIRKKADLLSIRTNLAIPIESSISLRFMTDITVTTGSEEPKVYQNSSDKEQYSRELRLVIQRLRHAGQSLQSTEARNMANRLETFLKGARLAASQDTSAPVTGHQFKPISNTEGQRVEDGSQISEDINAIGSRLALAKNVSLFGVKIPMSVQSLVLMLALSGTAEAATVTAYQIDDFDKLTGSVLYSETLPSGNNLVNVAGARLLSRSPSEGVSHLANMNAKFKSMQLAIPANMISVGHRANIEIPFQYISREYTEVYLMMLRSIREATYGKKSHFYLQLRNMSAEDKADLEEAIKPYNTFIFIGEAPKDQGVTVQLVPTDVEQVITPNGEIKIAIGLGDWMVGPAEMYFAIASAYLLAPTGKFIPENLRANSIPAAFMEGYNVLSSQYVSPDTAANNLSGRNPWNVFKMVFIKPSIEKLIEGARFLANLKRQLTSAA